MIQPEDWINENLPGIIAYPVRAVLTTLYIVVGAIFFIGMIIWISIKSLYKTPASMKKWLDKVKQS